jgi:hypothetical protein
MLNELSHMPCLDWIEKKAKSGKVETQKIFAVPENSCREGYQPAEMNFHSNEIPDFVLTLNG